MATITYVDDINIGSSAIYHAPSPTMREHLTNSVNNYLTTIGAACPDISNMVKQKYDAVANSSTIQYLNNLKNRINSSWNTNTIKYLKDINDIQQAPDVMKRWVMAQPDIRQRYNTGNINGYDKTYTNIHPGGAGNKHYDYRRVTDGVVMSDSVSDGVTYSHYYEHVHKCDILNIVEKSNILSTWDIISNHFENNGLEDPTSVWNEML